MPVAGRSVLCVAVCMVPRWVFIHDIKEVEDVGHNSKVIREMMRKEMK